MAKLTKEELTAQIQEIAENWQEKPETIADFLIFSSRFHRYSTRNMMLVYRQNPNATFLDSFNGWKEKYPVKRGEHGLKILVPTPVTLFERNGELVQLKYATKEERAAIKSGAIETRQSMHFSLGTVFDISQTTCPVEEYPHFYHMGYADANARQLLNDLIEYAEKELSCPIYLRDLQSISLRGQYNPINHDIAVNEKLKDSERVSTLIHELGHALLHNIEDRDKEASVTQKELEADMLALMVQSRLGVEVTEGRARHLAGHYRAFMAEQKVEIEAEKKKNDVFLPIVNRVFQRFDETWGRVEKYLNQSIREKETVSPSIQNQTEIAAAGYDEVVGRAGNSGQEEAGHVFWDETAKLPTFAEQVEAIINDDTISFSNSHLLVGQTPEILGCFGFDTKLPILVSQNKVRNMMADEPVRGRGTAHGLDKEAVAQLPAAIADPAIVMQSRTRPEDSIVITTEMLDNMQRPIIAALRKGRGYLLAKDMEANILTSAYGRAGFLNFVNAAIRENRILYANKEKCHSLEKILSVQFADNFSLTVVNTSIPENPKTVNGKNMKRYETEIARLCEKLKQEIADYDGRQKGQNKGEHHHEDIKKQ